MKLLKKLTTFLSEHPSVLVGLGCIWLLAGFLGLRTVWIYATAPGRSGDAPLHWPVSSSISRTGHSATLVVMAHPKCPCTRATIEGLAWIMARAESPVEAKVLFFLPGGFSESWAHTDLWDSAQSIPGVAVSVDRSGVEAHRFGAEVSGYTLLFDGSGRLLFKGGLTSSRGHSGDSMGRNTIQSLLIRPLEKALDTPAFGCPLFAEKSDCGEEAQLCQRQ